MSTINGSLSLCRERLCAGGGRNWIGSGFTGWIRALRRGSVHHPGRSEPIWLESGCSCRYNGRSRCGIWEILVNATAGEECDDGMHCDDVDHTRCTIDSECAGMGDQLCKPRSDDGCDENCQRE